MKLFYKIKIIDFANIFSIAILLDKIWLSVFFLETVAWLWIISILYYGISYGIFRCTPAELIFKAFLLDKQGGKASRITIIKRELINRIGIGYVLPLIVLYLSGFNDLYYITFYIVLANLIVNVIYFKWKNEFWFDSLAKTKKEVKHIKSKTIPAMIISSFGLWSVTLIYILFWNSGYINTYNNLNYPLRHIEYPHNGQVKKYTDFLSENRQSAKDYILDLFNTYDIVILMENYRIEDNQWDMFYEIVSDPRFINKVGTVFTEYGCKSDQPKANKFLTTAYANDTLVERATAELMQYNVGNFFFYMKKLNLLNQILPDSLKVKNYFTDVLKEKYLHTYIEPDTNLKLLPHRDSLMAQQVIDWYMQNKKKCLVITNFTHTFSVNEKAKVVNYSAFDKYIAKKEAQYIRNSFPDKTATVMQYRKSVKRNFYTPIHQGKWNTAFKENGFISIGFNLDGSPFGNDEFDLIPSKGRKLPLKYKDVFTGFVFYKPEEAFKTKIPNYMKHGANFEYKEALKNNIKIDTEHALNEIEEYEDYYNDENKPIWLQLGGYYHFLDLICWLLMIIIAIKNLI